MTRISRRTALVATLGLGLAACSVREADRTSRPAATPSGAPARAAAPDPVAAPSGDTRPRWPLTGRPASSASITRHAAVAVKVPDNEWEHPQVGLDEADLVFVELEGYLDGAGQSSTRLVPVFHSTLPATVAPVRSLRPVDVPLLSPLDAVVANTGGSRWVLDYVKDHRDHLEGTLSYLATTGTGAYGTDGSRVYSVGGVTYYDRATVCHPAVLARLTRRLRSGPTQPYFPFAAADTEVSTLAGASARFVAVPYKGDGYPMSYRYDARRGHYLRSMPWGPHVLADGTRVSTDNVLVIRSRQSRGKIFRGRGGAEPLLDIIDAEGTFDYFHGGRHVTGGWRKGRVDQPFDLTLADGRPLRMAPGRTFVELPDTAAKVTIRP